MSQPGGESKSEEEKEKNHWKKIRAAHRKNKPLYFKTPCTARINPSTEIETRLRAVRSKKKVFHQKNRKIRKTGKQGKKE